MSQETGPGQPGIGLLYTKTSTPRDDGQLKGALDMIGDVSVTSQFKVSLHLPVSGNRDTTTLEGWLGNCNLINTLSDVTSYDFMCSDTSLPGAGFNVGEEFGSRQGIIEYTPNSRVYPAFDMTFNVDKDYKIIRLFEEWMNYINPIYSSGVLNEPSPSGQGDAKNSSDYFRFRYPNDYRRIISVTKFERGFKSQKTSRIIDVPSLTYRMIDAFPNNVTAIPVTYEGSTVTKTIVSFSYTRYVLEKHKGER